MAAKWWTLVAVCTGVFMLLLDITIVNVALPDIQRDLDASLSDLQWVIDAYALSLAALLLTAGSLADRFGRRLLFGIGVGVFTVGSLLCGLAPNIMFLTLARAGQGVGGAIMFATALALLSGSFRGQDRGTAFGFFGATTGVAVAIGPVMGGLLTSGLSWHWIFWVNIPICALALAVTVTQVEESRDPAAGRPDWVGFATFSLGLGLLVLGLIRGGVDGWGATLVVVSLVGSAVLLVGFVVSQLVRSDPMFDLSLLRKPTFTGGLIAAMGVSASVFSVLTYLIIYVQNVLGYSAIGAGVRFLFLSGMSFVAAAVAGRLTNHLPTKWLISPGFLLVAVGLLLLLGITPESSWTHLIPGLIVAGVGIGLINVPLASTAVGVVTPPARGDGLRRELHLPPGGHRHRHRRPGRDLQQPGPRRHPRRSRRYTGQRPCRHDRQRGDRRPDPVGARPCPGQRPLGHRQRRHLELRRRAEPHQHHRRSHRRCRRRAVPVPDPPT